MSKTTNFIKDLKKTVKNPLHIKIIESYEKARNSEQMIVDIRTLIKKKYDEINKK